MSCAVRPTRRVGTSSAQARSVSAQAWKPWSLRRPLVSIVMGLDEHRGQITGEWIDTDTGEVARTRVAPADRAGVRKWLSRFRGKELAVALEATTGWRFAVEELRRVGAEVHLAEPAETAGLRGPKRRAKGDRADARHLRELLMIGRLPESWVPPDHILDLRARVRVRHTLSEQRSEWQQADPGDAVSPRLPAAPPADDRRWTRVACGSAVDRRGARAGHGCAGDDRRDRGADRAVRQGAARVRAPPGRLQGVDGPLRDRAWSRSRSWPSWVTAPASPPPDWRSATPGWTSPCTNQINAARPGTCRVRVRRRCAGRCLSPPSPPAGRAAPTPTTTERRPRGSAQPRVPVSRAQAAQAQLPHAARARRGGPGTRMTSLVRAKPFVTQIAAAGSRQLPARHAHVDGPERPSGRNASPSGITPSHIMSPAPEPTRGSWTEVRLGARAHTTRTIDRAHAPPTPPQCNPDKPWTRRLTRDLYTSKEAHDHEPTHHREENRCGVTWVRRRVVSS
jgi:hypothetical protein